MTPIRKLIVAFWIFIVIMLLWQFYTYDQGLKEAEIDHPQQEHFYFFHTNAASVAPSQAHIEGPDVEQTLYTVEENAPSLGSFTCHVTLKNIGNAKAVGIQVAVRPYRGTRTDDEDVGPNTQQTTILNDNDYRAQLTEWVTFPDLAPGESSAQSVIFLSRTDVKPGPNPKPEILFQAEKAK
jgi:hypothetical protein